MSEERLSKLQKLILRCVAEYPQKLLERVRAGKISSEEANLGLRIASSVHSYPRGKTECLQGQFSATFSRSLKNLERKGLVELKRRWVLVSTNEPYGKAYRIKLTPKARNILNVKVSPHSEFWNGYFKEHYGGKVCEIKSS